ncbi:hypothetical protein NWI01_04430 [Nitrobacter winogradskyi]|uniref:Uncharacterized protein n=1 Tax=Nitrobacter winogradskyi TaxID=913 RepID=A0A4Y3W911_NITWI|nr:hypothetical protein NWI01_04430 [Nitrobacter winogradskyi]
MDTGSREENASTTIYVFSSEVDTGSREEDALVGMQFASVEAWTPDSDDPARMSQSGRGVC